MADRTIFDGPRVRVIDLYNLPFPETLRLQDSLVEELRFGKGKNVILFAEHPPCYSADSLVFTEPHNHFRIPPVIKNGRIELGGIRVIEARRARGLAYHGPGILSCYTVVRTRETCTCYQKYLGDAVLALLAFYGISGRRRSILFPDIWVGSNKIAPIGNHWRTSDFNYGWFGCNIHRNPDLSFFDPIFLCGVRDAEYGVTSLAQEAGTAPSYSDLCNVFLQELKKHLFPILE